MLLAAPSELMQGPRGCPPARPACPCPAPAAPRPSIPQRRSQGSSRGLRSGQLRAMQGDGSLQGSLPQPEDAKGAIAVGLQLFNAGDYEAALEAFESALSLPGTGVKQFRDKPAAVSPGERQAALYNMACCHARLGSGRDGLQALIYLLEAGYEDFEQLRLDPDLAALRKEPQYDMVIQRFKPQQQGFFGSLLKGFQG